MVSDINGRTTRAYYYPFHLLLAAMLASSLVGCATGPDFERPSLAVTPNYTARDMPTQTASSPVAFGVAQLIREDATVDSQWWRTLGSERLNALIEQAFHANPTLESANATLRQAQELYSSQAGATQVPHVDLALGQQRQRFNPSAQGQTGDPREFNLYSAGIGVHYQVDLSGANSRALEALAAKIEYRRFELEASQLTLAGNIVSAAITQARLAGQTQATEAILRAQDEQLLIVKKQVALGHGIADEISLLQVQAEQTRADLVSLRKQSRQIEHLLLVLAGRSPGDPDVPHFVLENFVLPSDLPLILPANLVRHRPDIRGAEELLHAANAEYGVAVAKLYPQINLSASFGSQALTTSALFGSSAAVWSVIGQITQTLFNPGLTAEKRASLAALDAAAANYRKVVLEALRSVADVLRDVEADAQSVASRATISAASKELAESSRRQYAHGTISYFQLLTAEQQEQHSRINLIAAQAQRLADSAALYQSMAGSAD
ncbi:MAG: efflux transporter outer membrane subunit [Deltaproteobacteria bacterium]|nr:efflux transporter outer membrane subunit [Deltaproteobacteria bacterium]